MSDHEEMESTLAVWVLGALEADEAESIRLHVESCASCRQTAARLLRAARALPLEVEEISPPPRLRERVMVAAAAARTSTIPTAPARKRVGPVPRRQWKPVATVQLGRPAVFAAAATVLLALLVGLVAGDLVGRSSVRPAPPQVARFTLAGHGPLSGAHGTVIDLKNDGVTLVDFHGLPALAKGKVYEVWLITPGGHPDQAAVFVPDANGGKVVLVSLPLHGYSQMAVTAEDGPDGASAPTQQPQLYGAIA